MKLHLQKNGRRPAQEFKYNPGESVIKILKEEGMLDLTERQGKYFWLTVGESKIGLTRKALVKLGNEMLEQANK